MCELWFPFTDSTGHSAHKCSELLKNGLLTFEKKNCMENQYGVPEIIPKTYCFYGISRESWWSIMLPHTASQVLQCSSVGGKFKAVKKSVMTKYVQTGCNKIESLSNHCVAVGDSETKIIRQRTFW